MYSQNYYWGEMKLKISNKNMKNNHFTANIKCVICYHSQYLIIIYKFSKQATMSYMFHVNIIVDAAVGSLPRY